MHFCLLLEAYSYIVATFAYGVHVSFCGKQVNIIILLLSLHSFYKSKKNKMRIEEASEAEIVKYVNLQI